MVRRADLLYGVPDWPGLSTWSTKPMASPRPSSEDPNQALTFHKFDPALKIRNTKKKKIGVVNIHWVALGYYWVINLGYRKLGETYMARFLIHRLPHLFH